MKSIAVALLLLAIPACGSTVRVPGEEPIWYVLLSVRNSPSIIELGDGRRLDADSLGLHADSLVIWREGTVAADLPLDSLAKISIWSTGDGILEGGAVGALTGAGCALLAAAGGGELNGYAALGGALLVGVGAVSGAIIGGLAGSWTEYELDPISPYGAGTVELPPSILVPALEGEDEERVTFYWKEKLVWLRKESIRLEKVPGGILITMPLYLRERLN